MKKIILMCVVIGCFMGRAVAFDYSADPKTFAHQLSENTGLDAEQVTKWLSKAEKQQSIIDAMTRPAESKSWYQYRPIFMTVKRINKGVEFWTQYKSALARAEKKYGVPAQIIVAIIGVETYFGRIKGNHRVLDALYTLGFHYPKRGQFFRNELADYFILAQQQKWLPESAKGSYAGAMGYGQFIPSSYLSYAVDFDSDGHIDLINNAVDAIGSVANYFKRHGWKMNQAVVVDAKIANWKTASLAGRSTKLSYTYSELQQQGVTTDTPLKANSKVSLLRFKQPHKYQYRLGLHNFFVISRYNHSPLYSLAAYQLSEAILNKYRPQSSDSTEG